MMKTQTTKQAMFHSALLGALKSRPKIDMIMAYDQALRDAFGKDVRMHWGQLSPGIERSRVAENHPGLDAFKRVRDSFDPGGVMLNDGQRRLFGVDP